MIIKNSKKKVIMLVTTILLVLATLISTVNSNYVVEADLDPASKILCKFEDGKTLVSFASTDYLQYMTRSKSAITSIDDVNSNWLNKLLGLAGFDFEKTNEAILGRELNPNTIPEESTSDANKKAPKVSAFDRFGMAGLKWSSYQGEWKYYHVDACASQGEASPTNYGNFYEDRLEPKSTYNEVSNSIDPRSIQFSKGFASNLGSAFTDTISNIMFSISKGIVTLTILFVGLSFTDITSFLGMIGSDGTSNDTASGVFTDLFDGLFSGFILITFMFTALFIIYKGLIKRELRFALNTLLKTIAIFIFAIIMASNPSYWIGIPNKVATYGQALVLSTMSGLYEDGAEGALCKTEVASIGENVDINVSKPESFKNEFEKTNENMRSMIGCQMWETLLFKPWVRGQYGAEYEQLASDKVRNKNEEWVGSPSVPVGAGKSIENWALFQLSTQTNAHAPLGEVSVPTIVDGVNSDWWRIADALSNYNEEIVKETDASGVQQEFKVPMRNQTTEFWQSWVGNNQTERLGVAFISILFGIMGSIAPLIFGVASAVYGLGVTLLMMIAPIFLLFGTWGGKGDSLFMGWLSTLANTVIKKVGAGLLLVLSLSLSMIIMDMIEDIGFIKSFMLMVLVSSILIKNKDKFLDMMANVNFGGAFDPRAKANQFLNKQKNNVKQVSTIGASAVAGGIAAQQSGQSIFRGARTGVAKQLQNKMYTSSMGMNIMRQAEISKGGEKIGRQTCITCHMPLGATKEEVAYQDDEGNYYCRNCADEIGLDELYEVVAGYENDLKNSQSVLDMYVNRAKEPLKDKELRSIKGSKHSYLSHDSMRQKMDIQKVDGEYSWNDKAVREGIRNNIIGLREDVVVFSNLQMKLGRRMSPPPPPEPLLDYIDLALINQAWFDRRFEVVEETYKAAWKLWYVDNAEHMTNLSPEEIEAFADALEEELKNEDYDIGDAKAQVLMRDYFNNQLQSTESEGNKDKELYIYVNGKLVLNNTDITNTDELLSND